VSNSVSYPGYRVHDCAAGIDWGIGRLIAFKAALRIDNLTNEQYVVVTQYPMPGRQTSISLSLTYGDHRQ
jgi:outer membrane receptor protein involved in Fe transport